MLHKIIEEALYESVMELRQNDHNPCRFGMVSKGAGPAA